MPKLKVLFICVKNSCRSQMAEGFARALGGENIEAWSAGSQPSGRIHPTAIRLMKERNIDLKRHHSKGFNELPQTQWDYVVTMGCGDACPNIPARNRLDWDLPDPEKLPVEDFIKVRDGIERLVKELFQILPQSNSKGNPK